MGLVRKSKWRAFARHADAPSPESQLLLGDLALLNADGDAWQVYADGGAINQRRRSVIRCAVNHRRRSIIPAAPAAMPIAATVATAMIVPAVSRAGRRERRPQHEQRGEYQSCHKPCRQMAS
jgi:hypothetical protein